MSEAAGPASAFESLGGGSIGGNCGGVGERIEEELDLPRLSPTTLSSPSFSMSSSTTIVIGGKPLQHTVSFPREGEIQQSPEIKMLLKT